MESRNCQFVKKDGTQCKNPALLGQSYCRLHLKTMDSREEPASNPASNQNNKFYIILGVLVIGISLGTIIWSFTKLLAQFNYIGMYYSSGQNNIALLGFRTFSILRYVSTDTLYIVLLAQIFTKGNLQQKLRRIILACLILTPLFTGIQNLIQYEIIGWEYLNKGQILEGFIVLFGFLNILIIWLASKYQNKASTTFFSFLYDTLLTISPVLLVFALSSGESSYFGETHFAWLDGSIIIYNLFLFSMGIDDLKGIPSLLSRAVIFYFGATSGELSLNALQSRKAEALQTALQAFKQLSPLQQEQLSEWITSNFKPKTMQRIWGIIKLVVSTFLLTILAQEPAVALLKWFLKYFFNIDY